MRGRQMKLLNGWGRAAFISVLCGSLLAACGGGKVETGKKTMADNSKKQALAMQAVVANDLQVVELAKVSERSDRSSAVDYSFKVLVRNSSMNPYKNVPLTVLTAGVGATVLDGSVLLAAIAASVDVFASDTVTIRQNRNVPFDGAALTWKIEGAPESSPPAAQLLALEAARTIPKLERGGTLAGIDTNRNGVRDDVEAHITSKYTGVPQRAAAMQTARALQATLLVDTQDVTAAKTASRQVMYAMKCVFSRFPGPPDSPDPSRVIDELEGLTTNTKARLLAYRAYNKALDGTSASLPDGDTCE
jgi:hypothetical protein